MGAAAGGVIVFAFRMHPAYTGIGDGLSIAWDFLVRSWTRWLPVVIFVIVTQVIVASYTSSIVSNYSADWITVDSVTGRVEVSPEFNRMVGELMTAWLAVGLINLAAGWIFTAIAVAGLRGRPLSPGWVVVRGLLSIVSGIVMAFIFGIVFLVAVLLMGVVAAASRGAGLAVLLFLVEIIAAVAVGVRFIFIGLAVFDGHGPIGAISESWNISRRSLLRLIGWGLMGILATIAFAVVGGIVSAPFRSASPALASGVSAAVTSTGSCYLLFLLAVLYESQRMRRDIMAGTAAAPVGPYGVYPPTGSPYSGGPAPTGWGQPNTPYSATPNQGLGYPPQPGYPPTDYPPAGWPGTDPPAAQPGWGQPGYQKPAGQPPAAEWPVAGVQPPGDGQNGPGSEPPA